MPKKYKPEEIETWEGDYEPITTETNEKIKIKIRKDKVKVIKKGEIELKE